MFFEMSAWQWMHTWGETPIQQTLSAIIFDNLFGRFPNIHAVVSEFGAEWMPHFVRHMDKSRGMGRRGSGSGGKLTGQPSAIFQEHVRVCPYPEDDVVKIVEDLGQCDSIVMGSDYPHGEGFEHPRDFGELVASLPDDVQRKILHDNALILVGRTHDTRRGAAALVAAMDSYFPALDPTVPGTEMRRRIEAVSSQIPAPPPSRWPRCSTAPCPDRAGRSRYASTGRRASTRRRRRR